MPLGRLTPAHLEAYRADVLASREGTKAHALGVTRVFLLWAAEVGLHELEPETIREALRPPGAVRGVAVTGRSTRWRRALDESVPPASPVQTLAAFGYPAGAAGLALVAEEMHALREALSAAGHERWSKLVRSTDHPANAQPGGAAAAALDALHNAATGKRSGEGLFLAGLGYEGPGGERSLLGALRELRAAFAAQQRETLGETVWRLSWTEVPIPAAPRPPQS